PAETPTAEVTPAETPTAEVTPAETPTAEVTPPAPTLAPVPATLTNSRPTLTGTAPPRSHVTVFDGARSLGQAIADAHGHWYFVPRRRLAPGEHTLRIEILAPGATEAAVFTVTVTVASDARPLSPPTIQTPRRHRLGVGSLLRGTAPPRADVRLLADETVVATFRAGPRGGWAVRLPATLAAGPHTFRLEVLGPDGAVLAVSAAVVIEVINLGPPTTLPVTGGS
ncbi:MAG: Ig-like domain-containing protein, partial [Anaerolineae bacterium]|nr:Ig-like domain-containing protein [Anaerolineae bacterium]